MRILLALGLGGLLLACGQPAAVPPRPNPDPASASAAESPVPPLPAALQPAPIQPLTRPIPAQAPAPPPAPEPASEEAGTTYTCPMHPEIHADHPGKCPKCGMTLVPETKTGGQP